MHDTDDITPLCCCEYIDFKGERNHILACCCNCVEFDYCCDRAITCNPVKNWRLKKVMGACLDRIRCPGRGGAFSPLSLSSTIVTPFLVQPVIAVASVLYFKNIIFIVCLLLVLQTLLAFYMAKHNAHSQILYYWNISSMIYTVILFEASVTPLLEIRWDENFVVVLLAIATLWFFYLSKTHAAYSTQGDRLNGAMVGNGNCNESICPICRIKVYPRYVHCSVCQQCVPRYDVHSFWLDCCISENNQLFFVSGIITGVMSLVYGSLLILTTVCRPVFKYGILVPSDCSDVTDDLELGLCFFSAVHCLGLAVLLLAQLLHHTWLVSRGISGEEFRLQRYSLCASNPYSRGCCRNWIQLLRGFQKLRH